MKQKWITELKENIYYMQNSGKLIQARNACLLINNLMSNPVAPPNVTASPGSSTARTALRCSMLHACATPAAPAAPAPHRTAADVHVQVLECTPGRSPTRTNGSGGIRRPRRICLVKERMSEASAARVVLPQLKLRLAVA